MEAFYDLAVSRARIGLVDDHPLFRAGLRVLLSNEPSFHVVMDVGSTMEAVQVVPQHAVDLAVIDIVVPPDNGASLIRTLRVLRPGCRCLGLSFLDDPPRIAELWRAGATGFALKTQSPPDIVDAVRRTLLGERYLPPSIDRAEVERLAKIPSPLERLTQREREVFVLLVQGLSNDDIATKLFIARRTVEAHRHHLMHKLDARSIVDLVRLAVRHGIAGT